MEMSRKIHKRVPKAEDIEIHVSTVKVDGQDYVDIREYVISLDEYGRGITFPAALGPQVAEGFVTEEGVTE